MATLEGEYVMQNCRRWNDLTIKTKVKLKNKLMPFGRMEKKNVLGYYIQK